MAKCVNTFCLLRSGTLTVWARNRIIPHRIRYNLNRLTVEFRPTVLPMERDGPLRVERRVRQPVRIGARELQDAAANAQGERLVVPLGGAPECGRIRGV